MTKLPNAEARSSTTTTTKAERVTGALRRDYAEREKERAAGAEKRRANLGGKPYVLLSILATHPDHHRRGVGAMHLKWGCDLADKLGLPAYLEATPKGKPLYERFGFEGVGNMRFDARKYGHQEQIPHVCMLRPAKTQ